MVKWAPLPLEDPQSNARGGKQQTISEVSLSMSINPSQVHSAEAQQCVEGKQEKMLTWTQECFTL